jgi:hypothetical protein
MRIPRWLQEAIAKQDFSCPKCKIPLDPSVVPTLVIGIKCTRRPDVKPQDHLHLQYVCVKCGHPAAFDLFKASLESLANAVIDDSEAPVADAQPADNVFSDTPIDDEAKEEKQEAPVPEKPKPKPNRSRSKITLDEKRTAMDMLEHSKNWQEWLDKLGARTEETQEESERKQRDFYIDNGEDEDEQNQ